MPLPALLALGAFGGSAALKTAAAILGINAIAEMVETARDPRERGLPFRESTLGAFESKLTPGVIDTIRRQPGGSILGPLAEYATSPAEAAITVLAAGAGPALASGLRSTGTVAGRQAVANLSKAQAAARAAQIGRTERIGQAVGRGFSRVGAEGTRRGRVADLAARGIANLGDPLLSLGPTAPARIGAEFIAGGAFVGGGAAAANVASAIPGPTRSTPGQIGAGLVGGLGTAAFALSALTPFGRVALRNAARASREANRSETVPVGEWKTRRSETTDSTLIPSDGIRRAPSGGAEPSYDDLSDELERRVLESMKAEPNDYWQSTYNRINSPELNPDFFQTARGGDRSAERMALIEEYVQMAKAQLEGELDPTLPRTAFDPAIERYQEISDIADARVIASVTAGADTRNTNRSRHFARVRELNRLLTELDLRNQGVRSRRFANVSDEELLLNKNAIARAADQDAQAHWEEVIASGDTEQTISRDKFMREVQRDLAREADAGRKDIMDSLTGQQLRQYTSQLTPRGKRQRDIAANRQAAREGADPFAFEPEAPDPAETGLISLADFIEEAASRQNIDPNAMNAFLRRQFADIRTSNPDVQVQKASAAYTEVRRIRESINRDAFAARSAYLADVAKQDGVTLDNAVRTGNPEDKLVIDEPPDVKALARIVNMLDRQINVLSEYIPSAWREAEDARLAFARKAETDIRGSLAARFNVQTDEMSIRELEELVSTFDDPDLAADIEIALTQKPVYSQFTEADIDDIVSRIRNLPQRTMPHGESKASFERGRPREWEPQTEAEITGTIAPTGGANATIRISSLKPGVEFPGDIAQAGESNNLFEVIGKLGDDGYLPVRHVINGDEWDLDLNVMRIERVAQNQTPPASPASVQRETPTVAFAKGRSQTRTVGATKTVERIFEFKVGDHDGVITARASGTRGELGGFATVNPKAKDEIWAVQIRFRPHAGRGNAFASEGIVTVARDLTLADARSFVESNAATIVEDAWALAQSNRFINTDTLSPPKSVVPAPDPNPNDGLSLRENRSFNPDEWPEVIRKIDMNSKGGGGATLSEAEQIELRDWLRNNGTDFEWDDNGTRRLLRGTFDQEYGGGATIYIGSFRSTRRGFPYEFVVWNPADDKFRMHGTWPDSRDVNRLRYWISTGDFSRIMGRPHENAHITLRVFAEDIASGENELLRMTTEPGADRPALEEGTPLLEDQYEEPLEVERVVGDTRGEIPVDNADTTTRSEVITANEQLLREGFQAELVPIRQDRLREFEVEGFAVPYEIQRVRFFVNNVQSGERVLTEALVYTHRTDEGTSRILSMRRNDAGPGLPRGVRVGAMTSADYELLPDIIRWAIDNDVDEIHAHWRASNKVRNLGETDPSRWGDYVHERDARVGSDITDTQARRKFLENEGFERRGPLSSKEPKDARSRNFAFRYVLDVKKPTNPSNRVAPRAAITAGTDAGVNTKIGAIPGDTPRINRLGRFGGDAALQTYSDADLANLREIAARENVGQRGWYYRGENADKEEFLREINQEIERRATSGTNDADIEALQARSDQSLVEELFQLQQADDVTERVNANRRAVIVQILAERDLNLEVEFVVRNDGSTYMMAKTAVKGPLPPSSPTNPDAHYAHVEGGAPDGPTPLTNETGRGTDIGREGAPPRPRAGAAGGGGGRRRPPEPPGPNNEDPHGFFEDQVPGEGGFTVHPWNDKADLLEVSTASRRAGAKLFKWQKGFKERVDQAILRVHEARLSDLERRINDQVKKGNDLLIQAGLGRRLRGTVIPNDPYEISVFNEMHRQLHSGMRPIMPNKRSLESLPADFDPKKSRYAFLPEDSPMTQELWEEIIETARAYMGWEGQQGLDFDPEMATIANYWYRGWKPDPNRPINQQTGQLVYTPSYKKPRIDATYDEMIKVGFEPIFWNIFEHYKVRRLQGVRYREQMALVAALKNADPEGEIITTTSGSVSDQDVRKFGVAVEIGTGKGALKDIPDGYRVPKIGPAFEGRPLVGKGPDGSIRPFYQRRYAVSHQAANALESLYGRHDDQWWVDFFGRQVDLQEWINRAVFIPKRVKLVGTFFQQMDFLFRTSGLATGAFLMHMSRGDVDTALRIGIEYPKDIARIIKANFSPASQRNWRKRMTSEADIWGHRPGLNWEMIFDQGLSLRDVQLLPPDLDANIREVIRETGAKGRTLRTMTETAQNLEYLTRRGLFEGFYPAAIMTATEKYIGPMMIRMYGDELSNVELAARIAAAANTWFSTTPATMSVVQNASMRKWLRWMFFSINESESLLKSSSKTFTGADKQFYTTAWAGTMLFILGLANVIHFTAEGKPLPADRWVPINNHGYNTRFASPNLPFFNAGRNNLPVTVDLVAQLDTAFRILNPKQFVEGRLSVPVSAVANQWAGQDFYGRNIDPNNPDLQPTKFVSNPDSIASRSYALISDMFNPIGIGPVVNKGLRSVIPGGARIVPGGETTLGLKGGIAQASGINLRSMRYAEVQDMTKSDDPVTAARAAREITMRRIDFAMQNITDQANLNTTTAALRRRLADAREIGYWEAIPVIEAELDRRGEPYERPTAARSSTPVTAAAAAAAAAGTTGSSTLPRPTLFELASGRRQLSEVR